MTEYPNNTPNLAHERYLKKQRRIDELQEKLRQIAVGHTELLDDKDLIDGPVLTGSTFTDEDVSKSRQEIWETAGELLRLDGDALTPRDPVEPEEQS